MLSCGQIWYPLSEEFERLVYGVIAKGGALISRDCFVAPLLAMTLPSFNAV
jgi:hypothetical protein